jgi:hypothetical protein
MSQFRVEPDPEKQGVVVAAPATWAMVADVKNTINAVRGKVGIREYDERF